MSTNMIVKNLCMECKNYQYIDRFLALCELGRTREDFREDGGLTTCPYWEDKR